MHPWVRDRVRVRIRTTTLVSHAADPLEATVPKDGRQQRDWSLYVTYEVKTPMASCTFYERSNDPKSWPIARWSFEHNFTVTRALVRSGLVSLGRGCMYCRLCCVAVPLVRVTSTPCYTAPTVRCLKQKTAGIFVDNTHSTTVGFCYGLLHRYLVYDSRLQLPCGACQGFCLHLSYCCSLGTMVETSRTV